MNRLHRFSIRHPVLVVVVAAAVTAAIAPGVLRLRLRTDGHALVPERAPEVQIDQAVRQDFGIEDPLVVLVRSHHPDGIYNPRTLTLVQELTGVLSGLEGLGPANVQSLATEPSDRFRRGTLTFRRFLEPLPETPAQLAELREDLAALELYTGTLVSYDGTATAILCGVGSGAADRVRLVAAIGEAVARADTAGNEVHVIGAPVAEALLGSHILEDLGLPWQVLGHRPGRWPGAAAGGAPLSLSRVRTLVGKRVGLLPLAIAIMALVFVVSFRGLAATLLPLGEAGASLLVVFGLMGWTGVPVYLTIAVLPVILVSMGLADEIHVFSCYAQRRAARPDEPLPDAVGAAMDEMCRPVVATALTTAVGFLSFAISPLPPVVAFGVFTAVGIAFCMLWTLTVIPALLVLTRPLGFRSPVRSPGAASGWRALAALVVRRPWAALGLAALGLALTPLGIRRLAVQDSWIGGFAPDSEFYRATQYFNREFFGTHVLLLALDAGHLELEGEIAAENLDEFALHLPSDLVEDPASLVGCSLAVAAQKRPGAGADSLAAGRRSGDLRWSSIIESASRTGGRLVVTTPRVHGSARFWIQPAPGDRLTYAIESRRFAEPRLLAGVAGLESFVRAEEKHTVGGVLGPADYLSTAEFIVERRAPGSRRIPADVERARWLWSQYGRIRGPERFQEVVDRDLGRVLVAVYLKNANFVDTGHLMGGIRGYEREHLAPLGIRLAFAGDVAVSQALIEAIVTSQIRSLLLSLAGILAVTAVILRSLRWGSYCMVPAALAVAGTFAVMGWVGIPLGVATSMFAGMILGVGVDFAIHLIERYRLGCARGLEREAAIADALAATGPAIVVNALAVAAGFGILVLSQVPANARLGGMTVVCLLACLAATLLVIPALLRVTPAPRRR